MNDQQQLVFMDQMLFRYGHMDPWEIRLRKIAAYTVANDDAFGGGLHIPFKTPGGFYEDETRGRVRSPYRDVHIRIHPALKDHRGIAQLVAERIVRNEIDW